MGFNTTTKHTNIIKNLHNITSVYENFSSNTKRQIKKAEGIITIKEDLDFEIFHKIVDYTFSKQHLANPYPIDLFKRIHSCIQMNNCGKIFYAIDQKSNIHAALLVVADKSSVYNIASGIVPEYKQSGAMSALHWHAMQYYSQLSNEYDFCGSTISSIDRFAKGFGTTENPVLCIHKGVPALKILKTIYKLIKK